MREIGCSFGPLTGVSPLRIKNCIYFKGHLLKCFILTSVSDIKSPLNWRMPRCRRRGCYQLWVRVYVFVNLMGPDSTPVSPTPSGASGPSLPFSLRLLCRRQRFPGSPTYSTCFGLQ